MKKDHTALYRLTLRTMWRRKWANLPILLLIALSVFAALVLYQLTSRQEETRERMVAETEIRCVLTDAHGRSSDRLEMLSAYVDKLVGMRHEAGCYLDEYIDHVHAKATRVLTEPQNWTMCHILDFASDDRLSALSGASVTLRDGWTEDVFRTEQRVCLVPEGVLPEEMKTLTVNWESGEPLELTVIGTVRGGPSNTVYCPFYVKLLDNAYSVFLAESCSFSIRDNARLDEAKEAIYEYFPAPTPASVLTQTTNDYSAQILDEGYRATLTQLDRSIALLRLTLPVLLLLCCAIGLLTSFLSTRGRRKEFAVMRCLGMSTGKIFFLLFEEALLLALFGGIVGIGGAFLLEGTLQAGALLRLPAVLGGYLLGAAAAVIRTCHVNVMKLMKVED